MSEMFVVADELKVKLEFHTPLKQVITQKRKADWPVVALYLLDGHVISMRDPMLKIIQMTVKPSITFILYCNAKYTEYSESFVVHDNVRFGSIVSGFSFIIKGFFKSIFFSLNIARAASYCFAIVKWPTIIAILVKAGVISGVVATSPVLMWAVICLLAVRAGINFINAFLIVGDTNFLTVCLSFV